MAGNHNGLAPSLSLGQTAAISASIPPSPSDLLSSLSSAVPASTSTSLPPPPYPPPPLSTMAGWIGWVFTFIFQVIPSVLYWIITFSTITLPTWLFTLFSMSLTFTMNFTTL